MVSRVTMEKPMNNNNPDSEIIQGQDNLNKISSSSYDPSVQIHKEASEDDCKENEDFLNWLKLTNNPHIDVYPIVSIQEFFLGTEKKAFTSYFFDYEIKNYSILVSCLSDLSFDDYHGGVSKPSSHENLKFSHRIIYEKRQSFFQFYKKSMADKEIQKFYQENSTCIFKLFKSCDVSCVNYFIENITRLKQWKILFELQIAKKNLQAFSFFFRDSLMMETFETFLKNLEDEEFSKNLKREDCRRHFDILVIEYRNVDLLKFFFQKEMNLEYFNLIEHDWDFIALADHALKPQGRINIKRAVDYIIKNRNSWLSFNTAEYCLFIIKGVISENFSLMEFILNMKTEDWRLFNNFFSNCQQKELLQSTILYRNNQLLKEIIEEQRSIEYSFHKTTKNSINVYQILFNQKLEQCHFWCKERNGLVVFKQLVLAKIDYQTMDKFLDFPDGQSIIEQLINYFNTEIVSDMDKKIEEINECLNFLFLFVFNLRIKLLRINDFKTSLIPFNVKKMALACLEFRLIKNFNLFPFNQIVSFQNPNPTQSKEENQLIRQLMKYSIKTYKSKRDPSVSLLNNVTYRDHFWSENYGNSFSLWNKLGSINGLWQEILKNIQKTKNYSFLNNIQRLFKMTQSPMVWNYLLEDNPEFLLMVMAKYNVGNFIENFLKDGNANKKQMFKDFMALLIEEFKSNPNKREQVSFHILTMGPWVDPNGVDRKKNPYNQVFFDGLFALNDWDFIGSILSCGFQGLQRFSLVFFLMGSLFNKNSTTKGSKIFKFYKTNMKEFLKNKNNWNGLEFFFNQINGDDNKYNFILENSHENIGWLLNLETTVMNYCFQRMDKIISMVQQKPEKDEITMEELMDFKKISHDWNGFYHSLIEVFGKQSDDFFFSFFDMVFSSDLIADQIFTIIRSHSIQLSHHQIHQNQTNPMAMDQGQQNLKQQLMVELSGYQPFQSLPRQQYVEIPKESHCFYNKNLQDQLMEEDTIEQPRNFPLAIDHDYDVDSQFRQKAQKDSAIIDQTFYNHERLMIKGNHRSYLNPNTDQFAIEELMSFILDDESKLIGKNSQMKIFTMSSQALEYKRVREQKQKEEFQFLQSDSDDDTVSEIQSDDDGATVEENTANGGDNININESKANNSINNGDIHQPTSHGTVENTSGDGLMVGSSESTIINTGIKRKPSTTLEESPLKRYKTENLEDLKETNAELLGLFDQIKDIIKDENTDPEVVKIVKSMFESLQNMNISEFLILKIKNYQHILETINIKKQLEMEQIDQEAQEEAISEKQFLEKQEQLLEKILDEMVDLLNEVNKIVLNEIPSLLYKDFSELMKSLIDGVYENFIGFLTLKIKNNHDVNFIKEKIYGILEKNIENLKPHKDKSDNSIAIAIEAVRKEVDENPKIKTFYISQDYQSFKIEGMDPLEVIQYYNLGNENNRLAKVAIEQAIEDVKKYYCADEQESIDLSWINCSDKIQQVKQTLKTSIDSIKTLLEKKPSNDRLVLLTFVQKGLTPFRFYSTKITSFLKERKILENKAKEKIAKIVQGLLKSTILQLHIGISPNFCEAQMSKEGYVLMNKIINTILIQNNDYIWQDKNKFISNNLEFLTAKTIILNIKKFSGVNPEYKRVLELLAMGGKDFRFYYTRLEPTQDGN